MSSHYGNSLTVVSPNQHNSPYAVPRFETTEKLTRSRSFTSPASTAASAAYTMVQQSQSVVAVATASQRSNRNPVLSSPALATPSPITSNERSRSSASPNIVTPRSFDTSSSTNSEERGFLGNGRRHSVIGLPSEYPATASHNRDGSVVSSFASSVASSLLMDELEDFEQCYGDGPKVYNSLSMNSSEESPLKCNGTRTTPTTTRILIPSHVRTRAVSDSTMESVTETLPKTTSANPKPVVTDCCASLFSTDSRSSRSSRSRRRRNYGMNENDFQKITNEFSSLIMQSKGGECISTDRSL